MTLGVTAIALVLTGGPAMAQGAAPSPAPKPLPSESSRGVKVLEPEAEPETPPPAPTPPPKAAPARPVMALKFCSRPFADPDLRLPAGGDIDRSLSAKLAAGGRVVVDLAQPYGDHDPAPKGLAPWLAEVKAGGGEVQVKQYCEAARGGLGEWLAKLFAKPDPAKLYQPARRYNVTLHADALDHVITQAEFTPKLSRRAD